MVFATAWAVAFGTVVPAAQAAQAPGESPGEAAAPAAARKFAKPVRVSSKTDELSEVTANTDGTFTPVASTVSWGDLSDLKAGLAPDGSGVSRSYVELNDAPDTEIRLYVNGQFIGRKTGVPGTVPVPAIFEMGRTMWQCTITDYWQGGLDDVRVFAGALTDEEISRYAVRNP